MNAENYIPRALAAGLKNKLQESKIIVLRGPRGAGKKTLLRNIADAPLTVFDCSEKKERKKIDSPELFEAAVAGQANIVLDEAQQLTRLQEIIDHALGLDTISNLVLCCSHEPVLQEELWEALRFQNLELRLSPLSYAEMANFSGLGNEEKMLEHRLIYGYYPEIVTSDEHIEQHLLDLLEKSVFTQLTATERINKSEKLILLLRLLAFNIGQSISFNELATQCEIDNETAERYIRLFEKSGLLFLLTSYNNGNRYELKKSNTVYFTDNGIRNALIRAFQPLMFRNDTEQLWKNWVISERRKSNQLNGRNPETYFWKTHTKQEMDYIEVSGESFSAYKMQWDKRRKIRIPASFTEAYPGAKSTAINRSGFWTLLSKK